MTVKTVNPYTEETLHEYKEDSIEDIKSKIAGLRKAQQLWKVDIAERLTKLREVRKRFEASCERTRPTDEY